METITAKNFERPEEPKAAPRIIKFVNFSNEAFTWTLNKIPYTFLPGEENAKYMEYPIALHFAKHLVNRELLKRGRENDTSPKKPEDNPFYMELFNRCVLPIEDDIGEADQTKLEQEAIDRNMKARLAQKEPMENTPARRGRPPKNPEKVTNTASKDDANFEIIDDGDGDED